MDPVQPIRERLRDLAANPFGRRIPCDVDPDQIPAVQSDDSKPMVGTTRKSMARYLGHDCAGRCAIPGLAALAV